jgi:hypothetical protein
MAGLNVEDPIATYLVDLFEDDDIESEEDAILGRGTATGPAPTTQMRLFEAMTASPSVALIFAANHWQNSQIPANLPHIASDPFARQAYEQPTAMLAGGRPAQRNLPPLYY